mmetsp:Transcript_50262/g.130822  ORF Transcript_50262/g.130822 Transcript_50262/m.130822 type:complete len:104 (+) Transcript_50262:1508-1819(+)
MGIETASATALFGTLARQAWEMDRAYAAHAQFARDLLPLPTHAANPGTRDRMRLATLSMVCQNTKDLGCVYPKEVAAQVGVESQEASGLAVGGQRRAQVAGVL